MAAAHPSVAIVDDDDTVRRALRRLVVSLSYDAMSFSSAEEFFDSLPRGMPSCALMDLHMPTLKGLDALRLMRDQGMSVPVIIITGLDQPGMREKCLAAGASAYLTKPAGREEIAIAIEAAITGHRQHRT
jgi:FixJ family two-component response regulator